MGSTVPDFFQEETEDALRSQVNWLRDELSVEDGFFAKLLGTSPTTFSNWRRDQAALPTGGEDTLRNLWQAVLHLLSFLNFDKERARNLFAETMPAAPPDGGPALPPPWSGSSLREYLELTGDAGIEKVERWVTGLRFGDPFAA
jgi:hypothetical protein